MGLGFRYYVLDDAVVEEARVEDSDALADELVYGLGCRA